MSYYMRGDYYRGDYYRGDPGPFSFIEKGLKAVARVVVPGAGVAMDAFRGARKALQGPSRPGTGVVVHGPTVQLPSGAAGTLGSISLPGNIRSLFPSLSEVGPAAGTCPKGFKLNKSDYFLKDGTFVPAGSRCVRFRSMNPLNHRALRRGLSRAESFERIARRTVNALRSGPKKFKGRSKRKR